MKDTPTLSCVLCYENTIGVKNKAAINNPAQISKPNRSISISFIYILY